MYKVFNQLQADQQLNDPYNTMTQVAERISKEMEPCEGMSWIDWQGNRHPIYSVAQALELLEFNKEVVLRLCRPGEEAALLLTIKKDGIY